MDEFSLIDRYFNVTPRRADVLHSVGDDAALTRPPPDRDLVMCMDTLVDGVHFPSHTDAADIAFKSLSVNLSDLAAMGAEPAWVTLALTMPVSDESWLQAFADSFMTGCERYGVDLIGGDTTSGPLSVTVHATGFVETGTAMRRDRAQPGDAIYVTGELGGAIFALQQLASGPVDAGCLQRLNRPLPRVEFARELRELSRCAIDISDGLLSDLGHVLDASGVGASIDVAAVPVSQSVTDSLQSDVAIQLAMTGGDDYELLFTMAPDKFSALAAISERHDLAVTKIGTVKQQPGLELQGPAQLIAALSDITSGYRHFG